MDTPPESLVERTLSVTRSLRQVANSFLDRALQARSEGKISLDAFLQLSERYQSIINLANKVCHEVADGLPPLQEHLSPIETATKDLEKASLLLAKVTDVLAVSALLLQALGGLVLAVRNPE